MLMNKIAHHKGKGEGTTLWEALQLVLLGLSQQPTCDFVHQIQRRRMQANRLPISSGMRKNRVSRSPRGRAFQDIVIQSLECTLAETVGFLMFFFLDLFELDAKLL